MIALGLDTLVLLEDFTNLVFPPVLSHWHGVDFSCETPLLLWERVAGSDIDVMPSAVSSLSRGC